MTVGFLSQELSFPKTHRINIWNAYGQSCLLSQFNAAFFYIFVLRNTTSRNSVTYKISEQSFFKWLQRWTFGYNKSFVGDIFRYMDIGILTATVRFNQGKMEIYWFENDRWHIGGNSKQLKKLCVQQRTPDTRSCSPSHTNTTQCKKQTILIYIPRQILLGLFQGDVSYLPGLFYTINISRTTLWPATIILFHTHKKENLFINSVPFTGCDNQNYSLWSGREFFF